MHGLAYDELHDEIVVPVALAGAVLVFRGDATGDEDRLILDYLSGPDVP